MRLVIACSLLAAGSVLAARSASTLSPADVPFPVVEQQAPQRVWELSLTNPRARPRLGVPDFVAPSADAELREMATALAEVLWADLEFEQEFYLIPRSESAGIPTAPTAQTLPTERWSQIGADFVVLGVLTRSGDTVGVKLQLVPIRAATGTGQPFAYEYGNCTTRNPRSCAHAIADHMHKELRSLDGVAQTQLAFVSDRDGQRMRTRPIPVSGTSKEIYIADYDGANQRAVTANRSLTMGPAWSPDARMLAYTLWPEVGAPTNIYLNTMDGRSAKPVIPGGGDMNSLPSWSPDGGRLAFASNRAGNTDIWIVNLDGSGLRQVTNHPGIDNAPTWSPTGVQIAFTSDRSGGNQIYVMNADGTGLQKLTSDPGDHDRPTWSPLGFIAYTAGSALGHNISLYDMSTGSIVVLTDGLGDNGSPAVSPNGRHIAFTTSRWGRDQIAIIDRTGRNLRRVTSTGTNTSPNWSRTRGR